MQLGYRSISLPPWSVIWWSCLHQESWWDSGDHSVRELSYTEDEEAIMFLEALVWMKFTVLDGKVTCVNVALVPARPAGRVLSSSNLFLGNQT